MYRRLLDDDVLAFVGTGAVYTLPAGEQCKEEDITALQEQLEALR